MLKSKAATLTWSLLQSHSKRLRMRLTKQGLIAYEPRTAMTIRLDPEETEAFLGRKPRFDRLDDFPEVVHLEISSRCQLTCPYCYVEQKDLPELSTDQWKRIIKDLAEFGVFQITFGGGEPTLREDLGELALFTRRSGLNLCMTTNGVKLPELGPETLCLFNQVNVSYHGDLSVLWQALSHLANHRVQRGINFLALCEYLPQLPLVANLAYALDAELLLLTAKGVDAAPRPEEVMAMARKLHEQGVRVAVDGLTCAAEMPDFCMQKRRFCDVDSQGNVLPCSFIREPLGNLLENTFAEIWRSRGEQVTCPFVQQDPMHASRR